MLITVEKWIRSGESPMARGLFKLAKSVRMAELPSLPLLYRPLFALHKSLMGMINTSLRLLYWTPMFRSQLAGSHKKLNLAGWGMPLVTGPVHIEMGDFCRLSSAMTISGRSHSKKRPILSIGNNVGIGWQTTIAVGSEVIMEDNVRIAGRSFFAGYPGHPICAEARAAGLPCQDEQVGRITLRRDVWLGTGVMVMAGVEIGAGTIVAAGSVVTHSLPAGVLAGGIPAKVIKPLPDQTGSPTQKPVALQIDF